MENKNWIEDKIEVRERLRRFSLEILSLSEKIPDTTRARDINYQIINQERQCMQIIGLLCVEDLRLSFSVSCQFQSRKQTKRIGENIIEYAQKNILT